jgi:DNA-binding transcriptional LysR family regulator
LFLITRGDHPLAQKKQVQVAELEGLDLICPPRGMTARDILDQALHHCGITIEPKHEAAQFITLAGMVSLGLGVTVMPLGNRSQLDALGLAALPFSDAAVVRVVGVLTCRNEPLSAPAVAFRNLLFLTLWSESELLEEGWHPLGAPPRPTLGQSRG